MVRWRSKSQLPFPAQTLHLLPGADHFFWGREGEVGALVSGFIADLQ